ncbi:uncharacterized protein LOC122245195 [Penaeus japonicus]|uniref:uncharacterized protein LOC122245195 n=1 Tax=Penaeus japonicus TaxID=27405 RepID=UPI001C70D2D2|nr:uncharacterized protein LOC122245195 [Penaeus japonicus]
MTAAHFLSAMFLLLFFLLNPQATLAQMGLRRASLGSPGAYMGNSNTSRSVFSMFPWQDHTSNHSSRIESSLAAIFRGVAYGVSTSLSPLPPPLPSTTTAIYAASTMTTEITTTSRTPRPPPPPPPPYYQVLQDVPARGNHHGYHYQDTTPVPTWALVPGLELQVQQNAVMDPRGVSTLGSRPVQTPYVEAPFDNEFGSNHGGSVSHAGIDIQEEWVHSLGTAWVVHVYCAAGLYSLLALMALFWLSRVHSGAHLLPRGYYITLQLLMFLAGFLRSIVLFHDPYAAQRRLPPALAALAEEAGWPCLTAALAVVVVAIVRAWRGSRLSHRKPHLPLVLAIITAAHLLISVITHLCSSTLPQHAELLRGTLRIITIAWGCVVGLGSLVASWRAVRVAGRQQALRIRHSQLDSSRSSVRSHMVLYRGSRLGLIASLVQLLLAALHVYAFTNPQEMLEIPPSNPWHWLALQSGYRGLEIIMWFLLGLTSTLIVRATTGKRHTRESDGLTSAFSCRCCSGVSSRDKLDEVYPATCQSNHSVRNFTLVYGKAVYEEALTTQADGRNNVAIAHDAPHNHYIARRSATMQSIPSDFHLLWDHTRHGPPKSNVPSDSPRPSSMLFNDAGFVRFRMQVDPQQAMEDVLRKSSHHLEEQCGEHNDPPYDLSSVLPAAATSATTLTTNTTHLDHEHRHALLTLEGLYDPGQLEHLLQNHMNSELYSEMTGERGGGEGASVTDYSSTDALSPLPTGDVDWSKYASTCSSISAANSFDVQMYNNTEVATYYHTPPLSSASSRIYTSHHHSHADAHPCHIFHYDEAERNVYETQNAAEQLTSFIAPQTPSASSQSDMHVDYLTDASHDHHTRGSDDSDLCSVGSRNDLQQTCRHDHHWEDQRPTPGDWHVSPKDVTPDSAVVVDYAGYTDDASGDDADLVPMQGSPRPSGLLSKIVKNNFSIGNNGGYTALGSEDIFNFPHHHMFHRYQDDIRDGNEIRPCGHRPRNSSTANRVTSRTSFITSQNARMASVHIANRTAKTQMHLQGVREIRDDEKSKDSKELCQAQEQLVQDLITVTDGTTQTDGVQKWNSLSPPTSRPPSSLASHSDLPSVCVDSEDEIHLEEEDDEEEDTQEIVSEDDEDDLTPEVSPRATPEVSPLDIWTSPTPLQAAV